MTTYGYTGAMETVPLSAGKYSFECLGAEGYGYPVGDETEGGNGGYVYGEIDFSENVTVYLFVGQHPTSGVGGFNGGGNAPFAGGGGGTDIRINGVDISNRIMVAGGGGGGSATHSNGGSGGSIIESGTLFQGGDTGRDGSGAGGGGYFGGGGAGWYNSPADGGSSYVDSESFDNITMTAGINTGDGYIIITPLSSPTPITKRKFTQII